MTSRAASEYRYEKLTWPEINDAIELEQVCLVPCGAVEQHGPHLPLDVDLVCPLGIAHGATDELGFHAVEHRHYVTDIHATVLHQLGLDPRKLEVPGRKRLEIDYGKPIKEILA